MHVFGCKANFSKMRFLCSVLMVILFVLFTQLNHCMAQRLEGIRLFDLNPDIFRNSPQLIRARGFDVEEHQVTTADGYILSVFRIINRRLRQDQIPRGRQRPRPVILWHGVAVNSESWLYSTNGYLNSSGTYIENNLITNDCDKTVTNSLSYTLSTCGYDVWLPNSRGSVYSTGHTTYNYKSDFQYWQYTLTELAIYDIPAVVSYILRQTGEDSLAYVGHSLGTDQMFALQSLMPEIGQLVRPFIALAPVAYLGEIWSSARIGVPLEPLLKLFPGPLGVPPSLMQIVGAFVCGNDFLVQLCADTLFTINGFDNNNFNRSIVPVDVAHAAVTTSTWVYAHLAQMVANKQYRMMDHGPSQNLIRYGSLEPPIYPLGNITSPDIALFIGVNDPLADMLDIDRLVKSLRVTLLDHYIVPYPKWNHQDFQLGVTQGFYVNRRLIQVLRRFD